MRLQTAQTGQHIDRRITSSCRNTARQMDVPIQQSSQRIANGFVGIVSFDENGIQGGDASLLIDSRSFDELGQHRKNAGRVAACGGNFTSSKPHFSLGHCKTSYGIHEQQHILSLVAERFSNGGRCFCSKDSFGGWLIAGSNHGNAFLASLFTEVTFQKLPHFPTSFTDECNDNIVGLGTAR